MMRLLRMPAISFSSPWTIAAWATRGDARGAIQPSCWAEICMGLPPRARW